MKVLTAFEIKIQTKPLTDTNTIISQLQNVHPDDATSEVAAALTGWAWNFDALIHAGKI